MERFLRIDRLIGKEAREKLAEKNVCIVGLGAVGGYALEALARSGIGAFTLVDFDTLGLTNINRQILALESTLGQNKTEAARKRVLDINPSCLVKSLNCFAHEERMEEIFRDTPDMLIDAIDSMSPKLALLEYAWKHNIPIVSSMGAALRRDPFAIKCGDLMTSHTCPLARQIRKKLRRRGVGEGISCIYSTEVVEYQYKAPQEEELPERNEQTLERGRPRRVLGSLPTVTALFGIHCAHAALEKLSRL